MIPVFLSKRLVLNIAKQADPKLARYPAVISFTPKGEGHQLPKNNKKLK